MIWPFTALKKLRTELAKAEELAKRRDKNFMLLHGQLNDQSGKIDKLRDELETERMKLVACGVGAMANTRESAAQQRVGKDSPYYCASVGDVYRMVDREIELREANEVTVGNFNLALDIIALIAGAPDFIHAVKAAKEAESFYNTHRGTKVCVKCGSEMIPLHSEDKKLCSNGACGHEVEWTLADGQQYQYKRNVEPFVEDRSNKGAEQEPPRSTLERL